MVLRPCVLTLCGTVVNCISRHWAPFLPHANLRLTNRSCSSSLYFSLATLSRGRGRPTRRLTRCLVFSVPVVLLLFFPCWSTNVSTVCPSGRELLLRISSPINASPLAECKFILAAKWLGSISACSLFCHVCTCPPANATKNPRPGAQRHSLHFTTGHQLRRATVWCGTPDRT